MKILLTSNAGDASGGALPATENSAPVTHQAAPPPDQVTPATPAANVVANAEVTEETLRLRTENEELRKTVKQRETEVSEWQSEAQRLKQPATVTVRKKAPEEKPFRIGRFV